MKFNKTYLISKAAAIDLVATEDEKVDVLQNIKRDAGSLDKQQDLLHLVSVLLSPGMNRNHDVFLPEEILPIRHTGAHKPVNDAHIPDKIVGNITCTYVATRDGEILDRDQDPTNEEFDLIAEAVLYKYYFKEYSKAILQKMERNELFVSVEVWFPNYDYLLGDKIIARNAETSAVLDQHLKVPNGGSGSYKGQKLGRVLRNMLIGGMGLVERPANPRSIIKSVSELVLDNVEYNVDDDDIILQHVICSINDRKPEDMMDKKLLEEVTQVLRANAAIASLQPVTESEIETVEVVVEDKTVAIETPTPVSVKLSDTRIDQLQKQLETAMQSLKVAETKIDLLVKTPARSKQYLELGINQVILDKFNDFLISCSEEEFKSRYSVISEIVSSIKNKEKAQGGDKAELSVSDTDSSNSNDSKVVTSIEDKAVASEVVNTVEAAAEEVEDDEEIELDNFFVPEDSALKLESAEDSQTNGLETLIKGIVSARFNRNRK